MSSLWLGADLGTSGVKVVAVDGRGTVLNAHTVAYPLFSPRPGWVEQDPEDWWKATVEAVRAVLGRIDPSAVAGIGLSGQMHGMVPVDAQGNVLRRAILWNDNRNNAETEQLLERVGSPDRLLELTNNAALVGYTAGKILWLRDHEPDIFVRTATVLNPKDFLRMRMTGRRITDMSDASGTGLLDVRRRAWSTELLTALDLPSTIVPEVVESCDPAGTLTPTAAEALGLRSGIPVYGGGGDAVLQTTSMGIASPGTLGVTLGTAGIVAAATDVSPENPGGRVQVSCGNAPGRWHVMGVSLTAGGALHWLRNALAPLTGEALSIQALSDLAARSPAGARGLRFLPYLVGERCPHADPDARGAWVGLDLRHDITDMTRAVIEGVLLNMRQIRDLFADLGLDVDDVRVSGGASAHPIWVQTLADVLRTPVKTVTGGEHGAAYGAALIAGVGGGNWRSLTEALAGISVTSVVEPADDDADALETAYADVCALYPALRRGTTR